MKKRLVGNTLINYAKTGIVYVLQLAAVPIMLNGLGTALFGAYVLVGSILDVSTIVQGGLGLSIAKYVADAEAKTDSRRLNAVVSSAIFVSLSIALLLALGYGVFFVALFTRVFRIPGAIHETIVTYALLTLVAFLAGSVSAVFGRVLEGRQRYDVLAALEIVGAAVTLAVMVAVFASGRGLVTLGIVALPIALVSVTVVVLLSRRLVPTLRPSIRLVDRETIKEVAAFSWNVIASKGASFVGDKTNPWIIGAFLPVAAVAPYSIASKFHTGARMSATLPASALMPAVAGLDVTQDRARMTALFVRATKYAAVLSLPIILSGIVLAGPFSAAWLGAENRSVAVAATPVAQVYLSYLVVGLQAFVASQFLVGIGEHRRLVRPMYGATAVNLAFSLATVRYLGLMGPVLGSVIGGLIIWLSAEILALRRLQVPAARFVREAMGTPYGLAIPVYGALAAVAHLFPPGNLAMVILYAVIALAAYWGAMLVFGLKPNEKDDVRRAVAAARAMLARRTTAEKP